MDNGNQLICILDAGSQFVKVIDRRVRDLCVCSELVPFNTPAEELSKFSGIIISGGPESVYGESSPKYDQKIFELGIPVLGICYGMQLMNHIYGGHIEKRDTREDGQFPVNVLTDSKLFENIPRKFSCLLTHGDSVTEVAPGFEVSARSDHGIIAAIEDRKRRLYGLQFHPEVDLTEFGIDILKNFMFSICGVSGNFTMESRRKRAISEIRNHVGDEKKVLVLVSGGVDSSVLAALLKEALPAERIIAIHIDNGFMRKDESSKVFNALQSIGLDLRVINAQEDFYSGQTLIDGKLTPQLRHTILPEYKRKIIGDTFMRVSKQAVKECGLQFNEVFLAQGTLRPDLIESASRVASKGGIADVIKTHHNDTQLVRDLRNAGRIIEPLADYHKDEVRRLGRELGLPEFLVERQPFPGPGLAVRILCAEEPFLSANDEKICAKLKEFENEMKGLNICLLPVRTVGVQGDGRSYKRLVALSLSSDSTDPFCSETSNDLWKHLGEIAKKIPRTVHEVNRVAFLFGSPVRGSLTTITRTHLTPDVILQLQEADQIVNDVLIEFNLTRSLSQVPVILFPADFGENGSRGICIRTFITNDFMTGVPAIPGRTIPLNALKKMVDGILKSVSGISRVCFDLTPKPPGTTEWE
uniref:GMP synthase (glutamine-hydrolyzing) n=1 Tax=Hirondellea gigas TaxID=1518452 RepID=A0A6A7G4F5_9CRUS